VLACGDGAVLSHQSAAALWRITASQSGLTHVMIPGDAGRKRRDAIVLHRSSTLLSSHSTIRRSIPVTKPSRTLEDLRRERRLIVETDGYEAHGTRLAFERDRVRDAALTAAGYVILRFIWRQLTEDAATVAATVRSVLGRRPGQTYD
jgi:very-short-patch-repair endonuclease